MSNEYETSHKYDIVSFHAISPAGRNDDGFSTYLSFTLGAQKFCVATTNENFR